MNGGRWWIVFVKVVFACGTEGESEQGWFTAEVWREY